MATPSKSVARPATKAATPVPVDVPTMDGLPSEKVYALFCASLFYGLSCMAEGSIPPRTTTVVEGARMFEDFLTGKEINHNHE